MTSVPPPRDLPPLRRARMRAEVLRAVEAPAPRRRLVPVAAAAGVAALVIGGAWALIPDQPTLAPPAAPPVAATSTTGPTPPASPFPGLAPAEVAEIERKCATVAFGDGSAPPTPGITDTPGTLKLRNVLTDDVGTVYLVVGEHMMIPCVIGSTVNGAIGGFDDVPIGTVTLDLATASAGAAPDVPGVRVVAGRVSPEVARVSVTSDGRTADAAVANGTYVVRFAFPPSAEIPRIADVRVTAYNAAGDQVGSVIT
ncbi:hypothetical protein ACFQV2_05015 [Actinokineospora soli]|uniref:Uncharacterized protein n=1 Tax=Actinokineospora soli TaxID=1048753 RepID=A0ABW2TJQ7_9PSEU